MRARRVIGRLSLMSLLVTTETVDLAPIGCKPYGLGFMHTLHKGNQSV